MLHFIVLLLQSLTHSWNQTNGSVVNRVIFSFLSCGHIFILQWYLWKILVPALQFHFLVHYFDIEVILDFHSKFSLFSLIFAPDLALVVFISVCGHESFTPVFCTVVAARWGKLLGWLWGPIYRVSWPCAYCYHIPFLGFFFFSI